MRRFSSKPQLIHYLNLVIKKVTITKSLPALFVVKFAIDSFNVIQMDASPDDDTQDIDNEDYIKVAAAARGRRSAVDARRPSQKMKSSIDRRPTF